MVQRTMKTAVSEEDYNEWDNGRPAKRRVKPVIPDPEMPAIKGIIRVKDINLEEITAVESCNVKPIRNKNGCIFIGYNVSFTAKGKKTAGWMIEADFLEFRREISFSGKVNTDNMIF